MLRMTISILALAAFLILIAMVVSLSLIHI